MKILRGLFKFVPIVVLASLMIMGIDALLAAPIATIVAIVVARISEKMTLKDSIDAATSSVSNILIALFILMFAYAMASAFMSTGVGASVVNIALAAGITAQTVAVVGIIVTSILSVATGTSWGTFAACAPIFLWLSYIVGGDVVLTTCAIAGGACFGDNIGLISDTTIVSSGIQEVEIVDRVRSQGVWSLLCLILAVIMFYIFGSVFLNLPSESVDAATVFNDIPQQSLDYIQAKKPSALALLEQIETGVPYYMIIPLVLVVGLAIMGLNTFICIGTGIVSAYVLGLFAGTTGSLLEYAQSCADGFAEAGSWVVVMMMWVAAFGGIMGKMKAFEPIAKLVVKLSRNVRQLTFYNGILCIIGNAILADEMAQIVTVGPIMKDITEKNVEGSEENMYKLRLRNATFGDAMGVFGSQLIPWHVYLFFYMSIAMNVFPLHEFKALNFIQYNFMAWVAVISLLLLTLTGLDRFVPLFKLPSEPDVKLKKS